MSFSSKTVRKLQVVTPVPADIDIANSVEPLHISEIAQELNLGPSHYDLYGKYKAKVILLFICFHCLSSICLLLLLVSCVVFGSILWFKIEFFVS